MRSVSIQCLTFGRPHRLEEVIACFHRQDYQGPKELVILNDVAEQTLVYDHPEVTIINEKEPYASIGAKRNSCVRRCAGDIVLTVDDDDLILSNHINTCVDILGDDDYTAPGCGLTIVRNYTQIEGVNGGLMAQMIFTKSIWEKCGGYPDGNFGEDRDFINRLQEHGRGKWANVPPRRATYLFAWDNGDNHLQGFGPDRTGEETGVEKMRRCLQAAITSGRARQGVIRLHPNGAQDYDRLAGEFFDRNGL